MVASPLKLVETLCRALEAAEVSYCHWKSNEALDRSATGENDLDLLIARSDAGRFAEILHRLGFKEGRLPVSRELPGISDWWGLDAESDRLVHVHAHFQLIVGDDMTKSVRLPIENAYLAGAEQGPLFRVPSAELELIVFVIRMVLKHATLGAALRSRSELSASEGRELSWLTERVDLSHVDTLLAEHLPCLDPELFHECLILIGPGASRAARLMLGRRMLRSLAPQARYGAAADSVLKVTRRLRFGLARKVFKRRVRRRLSAGGCVIALVGGDGSGKSSAVKELHDFLGREFDVRAFHLGKPPRPLISRAVRGVIRASRSAPQPSGQANRERRSALAELTWFVVNARDRRRTYSRARRFATNGGIAVCDRFPLDEISLMDGPRAAVGSSAPRAAWWARKLARLESKLYDDILPPDVLIVMSVDPDRAVSRRTEQDAGLVGSRSAEVQTVNWGGTPAIVIDANGPHSAVLAEIRSLVWSRI